MKSTERFEKVNIDRLVPYARNARTHSKEQILQLRSSLREFGFVNPVIVDKDLNIIAGHGRIMAAREEGLTEIPCVFVEHLTEAQKRAYILADKMAINAGLDEELLALEFADLKELGCRPRNYGL
jgi:ParB-like chromosome segregation protein Spo0J